MERRPEVSQIIKENTREAAGIVKEGVEIFSSRSFDATIILLMHITSSHKKLRRFLLPAVGRFYAKAIEHREERLHKYPLGAMV